MLIYIYDRDYPTLKSFDTFLQQLLPGSELCFFTAAAPLFKATTARQPDIIFAQAEDIPPEDLVKRLHMAAPMAKTVLTASDLLAVDCLNAGAAGCLARPVTAPALRGVLVRLRHPLLAKLLRHDR